MGNVIAGFVIAGFNGGAVLLGNVVAGFNGGAVLLGNPIAGVQTHCNGGLEVAVGTVLLGNAIAGGQTHCDGGFQVALQLKVSMVARCYWGMPVEVAKCVVMVSFQRATGCR